MDFLDTVTGGIDNAVEAVLAPVTGTAHTTGAAATALRGEITRTWQGVFASSIPPGGTNWNAYSHEQLYAMVHTNADPGQVGAQSSVLDGLGRDASDTADQLTTHRKQVSEHWQGEASGAHDTTLTEHSAGGNAVAEHAAALSAAVARASEALSRAQAQMPAPVDVAAVAAADALRGANFALTSVTGASASWFGASMLAANKKAEAVEVMQAFEQSLTAANPPETPSKLPPPVRTGTSLPTPRPASSAAMGTVPPPRPAGSRTRPTTRTTATPPAGSPTAAAAGAFPGAGSPTAAAAAEAGTLPASAAAPLTNTRTTPTAGTLPADSGAASPAESRTTPATTGRPPIRSIPSAASLTDPATPASPTDTRTNPATTGAPAIPLTRTTPTSLPRPTSTGGLTGGVPASQGTSRSRRSADLPEVGLPSGPDGRANGRPVPWRDLVGRGRTPGLLTDAEPRMTTPGAATANRRRDGDREHHSRIPRGDKLFTLDDKTPPPVIGA